MKIAFIGFGEAARAFRDSLAAADPGLVFSAYDILFDTEGMEGPTAEAARAAGVSPLGSPSEAIAHTDWIVSAVTASSSLAAGRSVAPATATGQIFIDINSVSPGRKQETAALIGEKGGAYVDMAVMAPVHPRGHRTPVLVAGALPDGFKDRMSALDFDSEIVGEAVGAATAIKMVRSQFVKGLEAITVETLLAASASGCLDYTMKSLSASYPGLDLATLGPYHFERTLKHGIRRSEEMRESAATVAELGLHGALGDAIADVQQKMGSLPHDRLPGDDLAEALARLVALRRGA
jgi:3-hydroxyisobutyrate dehydrogenase-like beta-hydroxyacid dehydrogenase